MSASNPFQIPSCFQQQANLERRRRERFKKGVVAAVAAVAALLVIMLIQGCMSEHARTATAPAAPTVTTSPSIAPAAEPLVVEPKPVYMAPATPARAAAPIAPAKLPSLTPAASSQPEFVYVVKPGDTLSRIAKLHQTTVKALKAANGLNGDTIVIGATLKLPSA